MARGVFAAALSGGSTPRELYRHLARQTLAQKIPWRRVQLCWGDERCVPPDDAASNYALARDAFIRHVTISADNVHRMRGEDDPASAAAAYEAELQGVRAHAAAAGRPAGLRPRPAGSGHRRSHGLALPAQSRRSRKRSDSASSNEGEGDRTAAHAHAAGHQRRPPGDLRRHRGRQGGRGRRGARGAAHPRRGARAGRRAASAARLTWLLDESGGGAELTLRDCAQSSPGATRVGAPFGLPVLHSCGKPGGRGEAASPCSSRAGEAPRRGKSGHHRAGRWLTARRRKPTESATESRPPAAPSGVRVRVKR